MVNEKTTFSNQKHKQEPEGLNSIQICHFQPHSVCLTWILQAGKGEGKDNLLITCTSMKKGKKKEVKYTFFNVFLIVSFQMKQPGNSDLQLLTAIGYNEHTTVFISGTVVKLNETI
jgi:hypothetical protein